MYLKQDVVTPCSKKTLFASQLDLNLRKKSVKSYILSITLHGATTWTFWEVYQKYPKILKFGAGDGWGKSSGPIV